MARRRRKREPRKQSYKLYIQRVLKEVHPSKEISMRALNIMNSFVIDALDRIATEATRIAHYNRRQTVTLRDMEFAVRLCLPDNMAKRVNQKAYKVVNNRSKRNSSSSSMSSSSFKFQSKAVAHKIASTIIAEKSLETISDEELVQLMDLGTQLLDDEPARVAVQAPCYVFGDIHGDLFYLLKYFSDADVEPQLLKLQPPICNLLFLGDYVDRGPCSLEVVALLVSLKLLFRDKVTLLRGNHEIMALNRDYSFREEVKKKRAKCYDRIYKRCNKLFTKLPMCAVISKTFLCMHGGLPRPKGWDFLMGSNFPKPANDQEIEDNNTFCDLLWADPTNNSQELRLFKEFEPDSGFLGDYGNYRFNEARQTSIQFNDRFAQEFFDRFPSIRGIFRAHENCPRGHAINDARTICTVFSTPRYAEATDCGSVLRVSADLKNLHFITLKPISGER